MGHTVCRTACLWIPQLERRARQIADPALTGSRLLRQRLLGRLYRYSPLVGHDQREAFFLQLDGLERIHPDERILAEQLRAEAEAILHAAQLAPIQGEIAAEIAVAIADQPWVAWILARARIQLGRPHDRPHDRSAGLCVVPSGQESAVLAQLPLDALPMPEELLRLCRVLGLDRVGQLQQLPVGALLRRFGRAGLDLEQRARGTLQEGFTREIPESPPQSELCLEHATDDLEMLLFLHKSVLDRLLKEVGATRRVIAELEVVLKLEEADRDRPSPRSLSERFRPAEPTLQPQTLIELIFLWLSCGGFPQPVAAIAMRATELAVATPRQLSLFSRENELREEARRHALGRLSAAFGRESSVYPKLADRYLPEARISWQPEPDAPQQRERAGTTGTAPTATPIATRTAAGSVPPALALIEPPRPLQVREGWLREESAEGSAGGPDTSWHQIVKRQGPYTLEGEWWSAEGGFRREYWVLTTADREVLWIYGERGRWFLQGIFD